MTWHGDPQRHSEVQRDNNWHKLINFRKSEISKLDAKISDIYKQSTMKALHTIEKGGTMEDADKASKDYIKNTKLNQLIKKRDNLRTRVWNMEEKIRRENIPKKEQFKYKGRVIRKGQKPYIHTLDIIRELEKETNAPVLKKEIMQSAKREGLTTNETEEAIRRLRQDGMIYDPNRNNRYKVV